MRRITVLRRQLSAFISAKLGRCPRCMRASIRGAILGWGAMAGTHRLWPDSLFQWIVLVWPAAFTLLWVAHILTFGVRRMRWIRATRAVASKTAPIAHSAHGQAGLASPISRRGMLVMLAQGIFVAALFSVASPLRATDGCPSNMPLTCGDRWCCERGNTLHCPHSTCKDVPDGKVGCYNPNRLTDEQLAYLRDCCPELTKCS